MRSTTTPRLLVGALAILALVGLAGTAQAQQRVEGDVLANASTLIGFPSAEDTVTEEANERDAKRRANLEGAPLRGSTTLQGPGGEDQRRDYLLGLSASGALGIDEDLVRRYRNGTVEDAVLHLTYQGGCDSPNGELTVRAIENRSWSPFGVSWSDTTRSEDGTLAVSGPVLAQAAISPNAAQNNPNVGCTEATLAVDLDPVLRILEGELGGISMFWEGERELNVSTLDAAGGPRLDVNFTTEGPTVDTVTVDGGFPKVLDTGERLSVLVNATDPQDVHGVEIGIEQLDGPDVTTVNATRQAGLFLAHHTFDHDAEGVYDLAATATDSDGWTAVGTPDAPRPHVVADGTAPELSNLTLDGVPPGSALAGDQGAAIPLEANVSDLSCEAGATPCADWRIAWRNLTLANGTVDLEGRIEAEVPLPRPGATTARLVVEDAAGHRNRSTTWSLEVEDTNPPTARGLEDSHLAPGQATTLENGTPVQVALAIDDDLPVDASLRLDGDRMLERSLPAHDAEGRVHTRLHGVPEGVYQARVLLDDGTHTRAIEFGRLTVAPQGAPSVSIDTASARIGPEDTVGVSLRDRDLAFSKTSVTAEVNGLGVQPDVRTSRVDGGQEITVHLGNLSHGDRVNLTVRAEDNQGLSSTGRAALTVDAEPPALTSPDAEAWVAPGRTVRFAAEDPGDGRITLTIAAGSSRTSASPPKQVSVDRLAPEPGSLAPVTVTLRDDLGNEQTQTIHVGVDEQPPEASTTFTREGLFVLAQDGASGVLRVDAHTSVDTGPMEETQVYRDSPTRFFVATGPLTRGDEIHLVAKARDRVGHQTPLGTFAEPLELTVPDRPPGVSIERSSPAVGAQAQVNWTASDPDEDPMEVTLTVDGPSGSPQAETVSRFGNRTIQPDEPGRYTVSVQAASAGNATEASTFFYLAPEGRLTLADEVPERVDPGGRLVVDLSFPSSPERVFVTAVDEANASTSADVELEGDRARATFDALPEGSYDIQATVVHEEGAVERSQIATVQSQQPLGQRLGDLVVPLLVVLALLLVVAIAVLWYRQREEEDEETEADADPARG